MTCRRLLTLGAGLAVLLGTGSALAFKEPGHRSIEAAAYEDILRSPGQYCQEEQGDRPGAGRKQHCISDREVIPTLIRYGVLNAPDRPFPSRTERFDLEFARFMVEGLIVQSHIPDHLLDRQLEADRQCFHFNARGGHMALTEHAYWGIPEGLVKDAYIECLGLVDALLRGVLYDPRGATKAESGMYVLMHVIEDSFADSHVARDDDWNILYVKPWNLRTWPRYFITNARGRMTRSHFSEEHHMGSDTRDLGYLLGPHDDLHPDAYSPQAERDRYKEKTDQCLTDAKVRLRRFAEDQHRGVMPELTLEDLEGEVVVPPTCLSERGQRARDAVAELLRLVAYEFMRMHPSGADTRLPARAHLPWPPPPTLVAPGLQEAWLAYRTKHLRHRLPELTTSMAIRHSPAVSELGSGKPTTALDLNRTDGVRNDFVYPADELRPRKFRTAGAGITTELRSGTPLWVGIDLFQSRNSVNHNRTVLLLDSFGWGVQVRLPLENEIGERPVGVAFDFGLGLPVPLSELLSLDELQIYIGARLRTTYTAQSIFESETRHSLALGFGGVSLDFIVGGQVWFGLDAPRYMYNYDFWARRPESSPVIWSFSGGIATDAF
jgi:hypothetical protein